MSASPVSVSCGGIIGPYTVGGTIGSGIFAEVKLGSDEFRQNVAIKIFNKAAIVAKQNANGGAGGGGGGVGVPSVSSPNNNPYQSHQFLQIEREINALRVCSHPHIIQFYDVLETDSKIYLIMEYLDSGELYDYILEKGKLSEEEGGKLFGQVVSALRHAHERGIVHRDLKPENILLTPTGDIKLVDFGLANYWNTSDSPHLRSLRTQCGSPHYAAPEVLKGEGRYSGPLADTWSLGVLLYAMLCGSLPFNARSIPMLIKRIVEGKFKIPKFLSPHAQHLIQMILQIQPENRPNLIQIQQHPFMRQYDQTQMNRSQTTTTATTSSSTSTASSTTNGTSNDVTNPAVATSSDPSPAPTRPLSRPEIISPQSYINTKMSVLLGQIPKTTRKQTQSKEREEEGYITANVNATPSASSIESHSAADGDEEEYDDDDDLVSDDDDDDDGPRPLLSSPVSTGILNIPSRPHHVAGSLSNGGTTGGIIPTGTLPPSSALSFQPESAFLKMIQQEREEQEGRQLFEDRGETSSRLAIPNGHQSQSRRSHDLVYASASPLACPIPTPIEQRKPLPCTSCGKQLRLRRGESGAYLLSTSISASITPQTYLPLTTTATTTTSTMMMQQESELCTCTSKRNDTNTNDAAHHARQPYSSETIDPIVTMEPFKDSIVHTPNPPPHTPHRSVGGLAQGLASVSISGSVTPLPAATRTTRMSPPSASPGGTHRLTPAEQAALEAEYQARIEQLFRAAENGDTQTVAQLIETKQDQPSQATTNVGDTAVDTNLTDPTSSPSSSGGPSSPSSSSSPPSRLPPLDVRVTTVDSWNSLHYASRNGHFDIVQLLLTCWQPLDINSRTKVGWTPLMLASDQGHMDVVTLLLRYGAAIHVVNNDGKSAIFLARESGFTHIAQTLTHASSARHIKHQTGPNAAIDKDGEQVKELNHEFFRAAECGDITKVTHLLQLGRTPTPQSPSSLSPPPTMSRRSSPRDGGVGGVGGVSSPTSDPPSPQPRYCVDIRARGIDNWSVLHFAARKGRTPIVQLLFQHEPSPDVNARTKNLWTPLMLAADRGHFETCQILLENGADPTLKSNDEYTAMSVAEEGGYDDIVALLRTKLGIATASRGGTRHELNSPQQQQKQTRQPIVQTPVNNRNAQQ